MAKVIKDSLFFNPQTLAGYQFLRYFHYQEIERWISNHFPHTDKSVKVIEFGGSNGVIKSFLGNASYEVAPNFPELDVQNLERFDDEKYHIAVIDNVLEHVSEPNRAIDEIWRILKIDGVCICTTPFLIRIHPTPSDYYRYTEEGLKHLFRKFRKIEISGWGNRFTLETTLYHGWLSSRDTKLLFRVALWNESDWPLLFLTIATK